MKELDKATDLFKEKYVAWKSRTVEITTRYEYESSVAAMMQKLEREVFALSTGDAPKYKNRKKLHMRFGQLELCREL